MKTHSVNTSPVKNHRGFTLIELMVAMLIGLFVVGATVTLLDFSGRTYRAQERVVDVQQDARAALEIMASDIRMAAFNPRRGAGANIISASEGRLAFQMDSNMSNDLEQEFPLGESYEELLVYLYDAEKRVIRRNVNPDPEELEAGAQPLASNVSQLRFAYFDENGDALEAPVAAPGDIRRVRISVTCEQRDDKGGLFSRTLTTTVAIRNLVILPRKGIL